MSQSQYSILFRNDYCERVLVCVAPAVSHSRSLAWRTGAVAPGEQLRIDWTLDYAFYYALTGALRTGSVVAPHGIVPADAKNGARALLDWDGGSFSLTPVAGARAGMLGIEQSADIPPRQATIGVTIDGLPAAAVQAQPSVETHFVLHPAYWMAVTSAEITRGSVVDASIFFAAVCIEFDGGSRAVKATLTAQRDLRLSGA